MADSDCVMVMGSNMAENHPVAFRWPMRAKVENGAKLIHVDPRFTRTSAMADIYAPLRAGSDIAFLGGIVNFVLSSERWNTDPFFRSFVTTYTNAATIVSPEFRDTEDLDGVFSGIMAYTGDAPEWPFNGFVGEYEASSWQYAGGTTRNRGRIADTQHSGEPVPGGGLPGHAPAGRTAIARYAAHGPPSPRCAASSAHATCAAVAAEPAGPCRCWLAPTAPPPITTRSPAWSWTTRRHVGRSMSVRSAQAT